MRYPPGFSSRPCLEDRNMLMSQACPWFGQDVIVRPNPQVEPKYVSDVGVLVFENQPGFLKHG